MTKHHTHRKEKQMIRSFFCNKCVLIAAVLVTIVFKYEIASGEQESEKRYPYTATWFHYSDDRTDLPVLYYRNSRGHFGEWISDSNIEKILIWGDGMIAWNTVPGKQRAVAGRYQSTVPVEKVEAVVMAITRDLIEYPAKNRPRQQSIIFRLDAQFSPAIQVHSSQHYESFSMDYLLWKFYKENREVFQSGDNDTILDTIKGIGELFPKGKVSPDGKYTGLPPAFMFDFRGLAEYYRTILPQAGLSEKGNPDFSDEEILKCVEFYAADVEHLLLMEEKILELLPPQESWETQRLKKNYETKFYYFLVERGVKEGKLQFFYSPVSEEEMKKNLGW